jgi:hypothetical protein
MEDVMTKTSRINLISDIEVTLFDNGWNKDRWGNFKKEMNSRNYRIKLQKTSLRFEVKGGSGWINILSDYFKNIEVVEEGIKIKGKIIK